MALNSKTFFRKEGAMPPKRRKDHASSVFISGNCFYFLPCENFFVNVLGPRIVFCDDGGYILVASYVAFSHPVQNVFASAHFFEQVFFGCTLAFGYGR